MKKGSLVLCVIAWFTITSMSVAQTIKIGSQIWSTKNLDVTKFRNGDPIPEAKTAEEWDKAGKNKQPAWCYYENDSINGEKYGKLYNWYAVNDPRGLAPQGWHIPSDAEWAQLIENTGGKSSAGSKMKSNNGWDENGNGTNESGFSGLPGGYREGAGIFGLIGKLTSWWSITEPNFEKAWTWGLYYGSNNVGRLDGSKDLGLSVRCIKN